MPSSLQIKKEREREIEREGAGNKQFWVLSPLLQVLPVDGWDQTVQGEQEPTVAHLSPSLSPSSLKFDLKTEFLLLFF